MTPIYGGCGSFKRQDGRKETTRRVPNFTLLMANFSLAFDKRGADENGWTINVRMIMRMADGSGKQSYYRHRQAGRQADGSFQLCPCQTVLFLALNRVSVFGFRRTIFVERECIHVAWLWTTDICIINVGGG